MIDGLKPYPAMKDSGVPWLGEVPEHWPIDRLKSSVSNVIEQTAERRSDELYVALEHVESWTGRIRRAEPDVTFDSQVKRFRTDDVLFGKLRPYLAKVTRAPGDGVCVGEFLVLRPRESGHSARYLEQLLRSRPVIDAVNASTFGAKMPRADWQFVGTMPITLPPLPEQAAIVRFLDYMDRRIRRYIRAKQKLIKLLEERVAARASEVMRHPRCTTQRLGQVATEYLRSIVREDADIYVALGLYNRGRGIFHKRPMLGAELGDSTFSWVEPGDLVISGQFAWEGAVALASSAEKETIVSHRYYVLRGVTNRATTPYLWALLRSDFGAMLLDQHSRGAAGRNRPLNLRTLLKEPVPVPPFEAQLSVDELLAANGPLQAQAKQQINLLHEYRTRLIADVVTGKLDVREATARLPEETDAAEPPDEIEDDTEEAAEAEDATESEEMEA